MRDHGGGVPVVELRFYVRTDALDPELERLSKEAQLLSLVRRLSIETMTVARLKALIAVRKTPLHQRLISASQSKNPETARLFDDWQSLVIRFERHLFRRQMEKDLKRIGLLATNSILNRWYNYAADRTMPLMDFLEERCKGTAEETP